MGAYCAGPSEGARGGIVLIQEIFGVNAHIRSVADAYAAEGYYVIAPKLFDRVERDVELGYVHQQDWDRGMELAFTRFDRSRGLSDIQSAVTAAGRHGRVGVVGYCFGGLLAWLSACELRGIAAAASYYGGGIGGEKHRTAFCPVIMHIGDNDRGVPMREVDDFRNAQPAVGMQIYAGAGHGFNCDQRDGYHANAAREARRRTLSFFDALVAN